VTVSTYWNRSRAKRDLSRACLVAVEHRDILSDNFFWAIAQQGLGPFAEERDIAARVGRDHRVRGAFDQTRKMLLRREFNRGFGLRNL